jgi:tRNA(fMet)-specific endonuclease VapC
MAARYLLDTDICSYIRRNAQPALRQRFERLAPGEAVISVITYGEMIYGAVKSTAPTLGVERVENFVQALHVVALPPKAAHAYGNIRGTLAGAGNIIGPNDLWIAAHALAENLILVTNNEREFRRIRGLKIENWAR